jgi:predicted alpha/beta superfamily hydrolase
MAIKKQIFQPHPFLLAKGIEIPGLRRRRKIWAFLPRDYAHNPEKRYPVVYFHDAQNIFEGWKAPFGKSWEVHNTLQRLGAEGVHQSILIGIEHGKRHRIREFQPLTRQGNFAPEGNAYADFVANKLKPFVDKKLRTIPWREQTALVGSSMGGLITLYTGMKHQDVFSKLGVFSPSFWAAPALYPLVKKVGRHYPMKIYLTAGQKEGAGTVQRTEDMFQTLTYAGFPQHELYLGIRPEGRHDESFWQREFETCYRWMMN